MSPGLTPAWSAGPPRTTPAMSTPLLFGQLERFRQLGRDVLHLDADPAARHRAGGDDLLHYLSREADRNGEADAHRAAAARIDRGVDARPDCHSHPPARRPNCRVDCGIGLDEVLEGVDAQMTAAQRADDAHGYRLPDTERIADGEHHVADIDLLRRVPKVTAGRFFDIDLQHREVGFRDRCRRSRPWPAAIVQRDLDLVRRLDHVMVGQNVAFRARR